MFKKDTIEVTVAARSNSDASDELTPILSPFKEYSTLQIDLEEVPQGRHLGLFSTIVLFISRIIGSGIWTTPSGILLACGGNAALFFVMWLIAALVAFSGLYVFLEMGSIVPRSGGSKVFLEFIYRKPKFLMSVVFSLYSLAFGLSLTNAIVFGKYALFSIGFTSEYIENSKSANMMGLALILLTAFIHGVSVRHGIAVQNVLGALKLFLVAIMAMTSIYVICFPQQLTGLESHFEIDKFFKFQDSSIVSISTISSALLQCFFSFGGWSSVHTVASEIKDPVRTMKIAGPISLSIAFVNYILMNIAYLKVIPREELMRSGPLVGSLFFEKVLGYRLGRQFVTISIALSSASNVFVVVYSTSRMNQEIFREGYTPFSKFMASNFKHTKTPLYSLLLCAGLTSFWLLILPPQGNSFNYIVSLEGYPSQIFIAFVAVGIFIIRRRFPDSYAPIRASLIGTAFIILTSLYVIIAPFTSSVDESTYVEFLPPYHLLALILIILFTGYWAMMFRFLPWLGGYELEPETVVLDDGLTVKEWAKISN
jgi:amino acid transporter